MIGYLSGQVVDIEPEKNTLVVLTQGVGYTVCVSNETFSRAKADQPIALFVHTAVREDAIALYGFLEKSELQFFNQLISVSGVGPKVALDILSAPIHMTQKGIVSGDVGLLTQIKGIGKKTAERIIVELKNKITPEAFTTEKGDLGGYNQDAVSALESLGYEKMHVIKVLSIMPAEINETEEAVKYFLKQAS